MAERKRCAIYTRKSTEEGLEQSFNSLDAQREACTAYVQSQAHEGWELIPEQYDDGGWSGGNMDRPGLKQLLANVAARKVDVIVVYKVDRLTRSLADFARIVDTLDKAGASFVSVTQAFNTTTSMGRLTLNVLLSFAQFEREVTSERIRDKIAASKRRGMWMGGPIPIGYRLNDRQLVIEPSEAETVRLIFRRYVALRSVRALVDELDERGIRTKLRVYMSGREVGGIPFMKGPLAELLKNPIYVGKVRHRDEVHEGIQDAIVDQQLWDAVQSVIEANGRDRKLGRNLRAPSLLTGIISDPDGRPMTPVHTNRSGKRYRYYVSRIAPGEDRSAAWRLPSGEIERLVIDVVRKWLEDDQHFNDDEAAAAIADRFSHRRATALKLPVMTKPEQREVLLALGAQVQVQEAAILIELRGGAKELVRLSAATRLVRKGMDLRLTISPDASSNPREPDAVLLRLVAHAKAAKAMLVDGQTAPTVGHYGKRHLWQLLRINWLAPDILSAIVNGNQPVDLTGRRLLRATDIPLDWSAQRRLFGFSRGPITICNRYPQIGGSEKVALTRPDPSRQKRLRIPHADAAAPRRLLISEG